MVHSSILFGDLYPTASGGNIFKPWWEEAGKQELEEIRPAYNTCIIQDCCINYSSKLKWQQKCAIEKLESEIIKVIKSIPQAGTPNHNPELVDYTTDNNIVSKAAELIEEKDIAYPLERKNLVKNSTPLVKQELHQWNQTETANKICGGTPIFRLQIRYYSTRRMMQNVSTILCDNFEKLQNRQEIKAE